MLLGAGWGDSEWRRAPGRQAVAPCRTSKGDWQAIMKLFGRYMLRQTASAFFMVLLSLTGIVWIAMALKQLGIMTNDGQSASVFLQMTFLVLPDIVTIIAPIALLIAALHTLHRLNSDSELIVMTASGATVWRYARPLLVLACLLSLCIGLANFYVVPWSLRKFTELANKVRADLIAQVLQPGHFSSPENWVTFHLRERDNAGRLLGLMFADGRDKEQHLTYLADRSEIRKVGAEAYLIMYDGQIVARNLKQRGQGARIIEFESYIIDLAVLAPKGKGEPPKPHARYLEELLNPDPSDYFYTRNPGSYRSELHERFASLLYPFLFVIVALAFLGQARTNRQGRTQSLIAAFAVAIGLKLIGLAATNFHSIDPNGILLVYGIPLVSLLSASAAAQAGMRPIGHSRLVQAFIDQHERNVDWLMRLWPWSGGTDGDRAGVHP